MSYQMGPGPMAPPPRRRSPWLWVGCGCGALLVIAVVIVLVVVFTSGAFVVGALVGSASSAASASRTWTPSSTVDGDEERYAEGVGGTGTEEDPVPLGTGSVILPDDLSSGSLEVSLGEITWDATAQVLAADPTNPAPAEGYVYIMVPVTVTYAGSGSGFPDLDVFVAYFPPGEGDGYAAEPVTSPRPVTAVPQLEDGDQATYDVVFQIPVSNVGTGILWVSTESGSDDGCYVSTS